MKFTKAYFEENKPISNKLNLDELIDPNGSAIEGDFNPSFKDIQTGPVAKSFNDDSDYTKGISTTTDKITRYAQPRSWWALYYGYGGTPYSHGNKPISENELSEDLVKKNETKDIVNKTDDMELEEKLKRIEDLVKKSNLPAKDKEKMLDIINDSKN